LSGSGRWRKTCRAWGTKNSVGKGNEFLSSCHVYRRGTRPKRGNRSYAGDGVQGGGKKKKGHTSNRVLFNDGGGFQGLQKSNRGGSSSGREGADEEISPANRPLRGKEEKYKREGGPPWPGTGGKKNLLKVSCEREKSQERQLRTQKDVGNTPTGEEEVEGHRDLKRGEGQLGPLSARGRDHGGVLPKKGSSGGGEGGTSLRTKSGTEKKSRKVW